jgi:hypothetical protein
MAGSRNPSTLTDSPACSCASSLTHQGKHRNVQGGSFDVIILVLAAVIGQQSLAPASTIVRTLDCDAAIPVCRHKEKLGQVDVRWSEEETFDVVKVLRLGRSLSLACCIVG